MIGATSNRDVQVRDGRWSPGGFEAFYRAESGEIYRTLAVVLRDHDLAREAVDEAMMRAFERWRTVSGYDNPTGWVYRVALNWSRSRLRKRKREVPIGSTTSTGTDHVADPELGRALARLSMPHREVIVFRYLLDLTQEEVAQMLGVPVGTVKSRLHRALETLRQEVDDDT
jgi:RNA polymerase sigma-70 factor (ECF subfamily)